MSALVAALALSVAANGFAATRFVGPTSSQPLSLTADGAFLAVANPDNDSVSVFDLRFDRNRRLAEIKVQKEPNGVAFTPDGRKLYVANTVSGTVSVIPLNIPNGAIGKPTLHIPVGTEPYGLAMTPNGRKLYVSNARSGSVSVIDTQSNAVIKTIVNAGVEPRGLAITNDGDDDDNDETLYVTQFLSLPILGKLDGADDSKAGHVSVISTLTDTVLTDVAINPIADTGFKATGDALARIPPGDPTNPANFTFLTGAYPNQLNNVAIKGVFAYLPNTGSSPNGPVRFDVNTQSLLSVIDRVQNLDANKTINMHKAVADQPSTPKLFITQPWAMAFENSANAGYVVSAASNIVVKVAVDPATGAPTVQLDPSDTTRVLQIKTGKNPRGIVVNAADTRAYVMNYVSRDITILNLTTTPESVLAASVRSAALPLPGLADIIHIGKELYNTSVGVFDPAPGTQTPITGRMSNNGWGSCAACHSPFALSDNVVWIFPAGPRRTIPQHADFDPTNAAFMRMLNWSANRDEQEDFSNNIRAVSGGPGLIVLADGVTPDPNVNDFTPLANGGRNQVKVRAIGAWDALKAFVQFGIRAPISPVLKTEPDVIAGRALFTSANCQQCHGGPQWTSSRVRYTPPRDPSQVVAGQLIAELRQVGTFDANVFNEIRQNAAPPLGAAGFVPPSLLSLHAFSQTFLHNGIATSLDQVMNNVTHRSAGTGGVDTLSNPADRAKVVRFLLSIDAATVPIP
jgi:YVTN family beta-propeller protein